MLAYIELQVRLKPSIYGREIRQKLIDIGEFTNVTAPSVSWISKVIHNKLNMTSKVISQLPQEVFREENIQKSDDYLNIISTNDPNKLHFFDESSVIRTTGNRPRGRSEKGTPAFEIQRYSSDANYTVNLLQSVRGIDHYNVINGPSNGGELFAFFRYIIDTDLEDLQGNRIFLPGDYLVMDNCGFHHGRGIEPALRGLLEGCGTNLLFQPPYSPHLNPCEYSFRQMKALMRSNEKFSIEFPVLAIGDALDLVTPRNCSDYFRNCGYLY